MEIQKSASRFAGVRFAGIRRTSRAALALLLLMGALSLLVQPARASVWQDGIWQGESVALTTDDGFIVSAQEDTADFSAEFKPAENQDGYVVLEIDVSVRNGATGQTIQDLEFRYENELIASVESVNARSSTFVRSNALHMSLQSMTADLEIEVSYTDFDGKTVTRSMWVSPLSADPQINFTRTASATSAAQGETVTLTYRVANEGSVTLRDVQVYDDMPGVGLVGTIDSLYPGNMRELTVQVIVDEDKTSSPRLTYHTDAQSQSTVYVLENLEIVVYNPNLTVTLKADDSLVDAGQSVTLVCNVVNDGNVDFSSATITDETLGTIIEGATIEAGKAYSWNKVIKPVETLSYAFTVRAVDADGKTYEKQSNAVRVEVEGVGATATAEDLQVSVTANTPHLDAPGEVTFNLVLRNAGVGTISGVTVTDRAGEVVETISALPSGDQVLPIAVQVNETGEYFFSVEGTLSDGSTVQRITTPVTIEVGEPLTASPAASLDANAALTLAPTPTPLMAVSGEGGISPWLLMLLICIALLIVACVLVLIWLQVRAGRRRAQEEEEEAELAAERDRLRRREEAMREPNLGREPNYGREPNLGRENAEYPGNAYRDGASNFGAYGADDDPYGFRDEIRRAATEYSRVQDPVRAPDPVRTPRRPARMQDPLDDDEDIATVYKPGLRQSAADDDAPTVYRDGRRSGEPQRGEPRTRRND